MVTKKQNWFRRHLFWSGLIIVVSLYLLVNLVTAGRFLIPFQYILTTYLMGWMAYILTRLIVKTVRQNKNKEK